MINYLTKLSYFLQKNGIIENKSNIINKIKRVNNVDSIKYSIKDILLRTYSKSIFIIFINT